MEGSTIYVENCWVLGVKVEIISSEKMKRRENFDTVYIKNGWF